MKVLVITLIAAVLGGAGLRPAHAQTCVPAPWNHCGAIAGSQAPWTSREFFVHEGVGIGSVSVGQTLQDAVAVWGQPDAQDNGDEPNVMMFRWNRRPGYTSIITRDGKIAMMFADENPQFRTMNGVIVTVSTMDDVRMRFGDPEEIKVRDNGRIVWYYWHRGFAPTFEHGVVDYIVVFDPL
jgi:hypothetical protein